LISQKKKGGKEKKKKKKKQSHWNAISKVMAFPSAIAVATSATQNRPSLGQISRDRILSSLK